MKILLSVSTLDNRGHMGVFTSLVKHLYEKIPDVEISVMLRAPRQDRVIIDRWIESTNIPLKIVNHPWYVENKSMLMVVTISSFKYLLLFPADLFSKLLKRTRLVNKLRFQEYDFILDIQLSEVRDTDIWNAMASIFVVLNLLFLTLSAKQIIECSSSIGKPFRMKITRMLSRFAFNKLNLIIARDDFSADYYKKIGVNKPEIITMPDPTFILEPFKATPETEIPLSFPKPIIGIVTRESSSSGMEGEEYLEFLTNLTDFVINKINGTPVLIAFSFAGFFDDRKTIEKVMAKMSDKSKVIGLTSDLLPEQLKQVIQECDMLVTSRFHPAVHAISCGVPVIGLIGYGEIKYQETLGKLSGQTEWLIHTNGRPMPEILQETEQKILQMKEQLEEIRGQLKPIARSIKERTSQLSSVILKRIDKENNNSE